MDIISINEYIKFDENLDLYNLIDPTMIYLTEEVVNYKKFKVEKYHEMRIDLIFKDMYDLEANEVGVYLGNIDIILLVNDIDNPLNIKSGMVLRYPAISDFDKFRLVNDTFDKKENIKNRLLVPNKSTKKDKNREVFKENNYSLPPTILDRPKSPVRISDGKLSIGGL